MENLAKLVTAARGLIASDLVLKNAKVFNVFTGRFQQGDVAVVCGYIAGIGNYHGTKEVDVSGKYITPGFIDSHVHLESSMVSPAEFARIVVPAGTTTVIADPHEIANVAGSEGIKYILNSTEQLPLNVFVMLPSAVPATHLEHSGAKLTANELAEFINHPRVLGLGELMNYPGVLAQQTEIIDKIMLAQDKIIDGHAPGISGKDLTGYIAAGVGSDHECVTPQEAIERLAQGMYIMLREGSAAKNLLSLVTIIDEYTANYCLLVTDDRQPADLINLGHINHLVKITVKAGIDVARVLQMATINAAAYFGLNDLGAVAPGYKADLLIFDDLTSWQPVMVYKDGQLVAENNKALFNIPAVNFDKVRNTVKLNGFDETKFNIPAKGKLARVIGLKPRQIVTEHLELSVPIVTGNFVTDAANDVLKLVVVERHNNTGNIGVGLVSGLGLRQGAIASTVAHDSHNIIAVGVNDEDIMLAVKELVRIQGGITIVNNNKVVNSLALPLGGLMSDEEIYNVHNKLVDMQKTAHEMGVNNTYDPFMTLAFLSLPVIPALKLTDKGLVDVEKFSLVSVSL